MITVILVVHILVSIVLIAVVLMQRSEGGALGIGGGGGGGGAGGLMSGRGVAGALVKTTMIFGGIFFVTSIGLTTLAIQRNAGGQTEIEQNLNEEFGAEPDAATFEDVLNSNPVDLVDPLAASPQPGAEADLETETEDPVRDPLATQP